MKEKQKNLIALVVSIALILFLAEMMLRFVVIGPPLKETPNSMHIPLNTSERLWGLKPNEEGIQAGAYYRINSQGFRDYEYSQKKPAGVYRIAVIGDSVTFGKGVLLEDTYTKILEKELPSLCNKKIEVLNFGVYGYNTEQEVAVIKEHVLKYHPDMIIMLYTLNDPDVEFQFILSRVEEKKTVSGSVKKFLNDHIYLYKIAARIYYTQSQIKKNKNLSILTFYPKLHNKSYPGWKMVEQKFSEMSDLSRYERIPIVLFIQPELYKLSGEYPFAAIHAQVIAEAKARGIPAYDLFPYFKGGNPRELRVSNFEDRHPNKRGHKIIAEGIMDILAKNNFLKGCNA